jgi:hypothetical protein
MPTLPSFYYCGELGTYFVDLVFEAPGSAKLIRVSTFRILLEELVAYFAGILPQGNI